MKNLPIGVQSFRELRANNFFYVDKTEKIAQLINDSKVYFLSRPRRFGKSLLINTLKEIFFGNKALFEGLWIADKIEWKKYPVIQLAFAIPDYKQFGLRKSISIKIGEVAKEYDLEIDLEHTHIGNQLKELIVKLNEKYQEQVVLLIDEYDKPIIDFLGEGEIPIALENRDIMKEFYSPIKELDASIRFFLLTGVSKFSKVSIFSELNHLNDITLDKNYATLLGYTEAEILHYFKEHITEIALEKEISEEELIENIRSWYNGYSFLGKEKVYNPFSVLNFFSKGEFNNYWFETGTPTFLIKLMAKGGYYDMDETETDLLSLGNFNIEQIDPITVLFQTGYLTLKEQTAFDIYRLGYPNKEVKNAMLKLLLAAYSYIENSKASSMLMKIKKSFDTHDMPSFFSHLNTLFQNIPYPIFESKLESYYHSVIFLTFKLLGYYADAEVHTAIGSIDAEVQTQTHVYILEFKVKDTAESALQQIKAKKYFEKYLQDGRKIYLIGIACNEKQLKEYLIEEFDISKK